MREPLTVELVLAFLSIFGTIAGVWWVVDGKIAQARAETSRVEKELAAYKLHVAETYMSKVAGGAAIDRATFAIEKIGNDMKSELEKMETSVLSRIERMENRVFTGAGPPGKG